MAAAKLPCLEEAFSRGWPAEARTVLPSYSPQASAVALWAPVIAWCLLRTLFEILPQEENVGALFDQLYLQTALAEVFQPMALEGEAGFRAAARVRLLLTQPVEPGNAPLQPMPWKDADVIWLTGLHEAEGHRYFNKEAHEQVLWWRHLPQLVAIAEKDPAAKLVGTREAIRDLEQANAAAVAGARAAGYRLEDLQATRQSEQTDEDEDRDSSMKNSELSPPRKKSI
jgi:hypothetical protein